VPYYERKALFVVGHGAKRSARLSVPKKRTGTCVPDYEQEKSCLSSGTSQSLRSLPNQTIFEKVLGQAVQDSLPDFEARRKKVALCPVINWGRGIWRRCGRARKAHGPSPLLFRGCIWGAFNPQAQPSELTKLISGRGRE